MFYCEKEHSIVCVEIDVRFNIFLKVIYVNEKKGQAQNLVGHQIQ